MRPATQVMTNHNTIKLSEYLKQIQPDITPRQILQAQWKINRQLRVRNTNIIQEETAMELLKSLNNKPKPIVISKVENKHNSPLYIEFDTYTGREKKTLSEYLKNYKLTPEQRKRVILSIYNYRNRRRITNKALSNKEIMHLWKTVQYQKNAPKTIAKRSCKIKEAMQLMVEKIQQIGLNKPINTKYGPVHYGPGIIPRSYFKDLGIPRGTLDIALTRLMDDGTLTKVRRGRYRYNLPPKQIEIEEQIPNPMEDATRLCGQASTILSDYYQKQLPLKMLQEEDYNETQAREPEVRDLESIKVRLKGTAIVGSLACTSLLIKMDDQRLGVMVLKSEDLEVIE